VDQLNNFSISLDADFVTDNLVKVQLNFASMTTSTVTELPQISPWEFASELGNTRFFYEYCIILCYIMLYCIILCYIM